MSTIGVLGGYGAVGGAVVRQLRTWALGPVVTAGRDPQRADVTVDIGATDDVAHFCASVQLVVNCTGAPADVRADVARAATSRGVPYVDAGGDEPVHELLSLPPATTQPAVLSAGMWPGLTGLLPQLLGPTRGSRLVCYVGGQDRFSLAGAADFLAAMDDVAGRVNAIWRNGSRQVGGVHLLDGEVPYFTEPATGTPFLSPEMERLARRLSLAELVFYTVLPGARLRATLAATHAGAVDPEDVVRASELDLFGRSRYQRLVFQLRDQPRLPTLVLSGRSAAELTGAVTAAASRVVLDGAVPPGVHYAADVLDPVATKELLLSVDAVTGLRIFDAGGTTVAVGMEEGAV